MCFRFYVFRTRRALQTIFPSRFSAIKSKSKKITDRQEFKLSVFYHLNASAILSAQPESKCHYVYFRMVECKLKRAGKFKTYKPMTLIKFNKPAQRLANPAFHNFFSDMLENDFPAFRPFVNGNGLPAVNISENEKNFHLELSIPGFSKEEIELAIDQDTLNVSGEKKTSAEQDEKRYSRKEFSFQNFKRSFTLPENVDQEKIAARFEHGILLIELPKKESEVKSARKIELQ
jgi:HSP20 family protein